MKVYALVLDPVRYTEIIGIFSDKRKAEEILNGRAAADSNIELKILEYELDGTWGRENEV